MSERLLKISIAAQHLELFAAQRCIASYPISSAKNGVGEQRNSGCTPRGWHRIRIKIGADLPINAVFVGRRFTGEVYSPQLALDYPQRDWILTRILWLTGMESGFNRGGNCDTLRRFIYIHGCPESEGIGIPASHGCIRMRNQDLLELFAQVAAGDKVWIGA